MNLVKIKSKRADKWIRDNWCSTARDIFYDREKYTVNLTLRFKLNGGDDYAVAKYPILYSKSALGVAQEPFKMIDMYADYGFIAAPGHHDVSICGLKILLKEIGIEVNIRKIRKIKNRSRLYNRITFRIYPKCPADYAFFSLYFYDDITKNVPVGFAKLHGLPTKKRKNNERD